MTRVMVPARYPSSKRSRATLGEAVRASREHDAESAVLHADLYQLNRGVARTELKRTVEAEFGSLVRTRYVVHRGFLVEETIPEEVAVEKADIAVTGSKQTSRWRQTLRRFLDDPDIDVFPREELDYTVITVRADD